jgi:glycerol-3-phosphate O-acyltransferase
LAARRIGGVGLPTGEACYPSAEAAELSTLEVVGRSAGWIAGGLGVFCLALLFLVLGLLLANDLRLSFRRWLRRLLTRDQLRLMGRYRTRLDPYKLEKKRHVRLRLVEDDRLHEQLLDYAQDSGEPIEKIMARVVDYGDEIIPFFNIVSYFRVGYTVAAIAIRTLYKPWLDKAEVERLQKFMSEAEAEKATVVVVMNHRSNADFVLVGFMLARSIALSYAVGEWARVWPLEWLFKSFGSYFVRRGCKDPVYHLTLRRYLQIISEEGVTQGIFLEGGLTRDGHLRPAKYGLLDSLATLPPRADGTSRPIWFVPVGINYDRVLEDEMLTSETEGAGGMGKGLKYKLGALTRVGRYLFSNLPRYIIRRVRKFGFAGVAIGAPVKMETLFDRPLQEVWSLDREGRKPVMQRAADTLLQKIAAEVPVTPVSLVVAALLGRDLAGEEDHHVAEDELKARVEHLVLELKEAGAKIVALDRGLLYLIHVGLTILTTREHVQAVGGVIATKPSTRHLLRYYANGVAQHLNKVRAMRGEASLATGDLDQLGIFGTMPTSD